MTSDFSAASCGASAATEPWSFRAPGSGPLRLRLSLHHAPGREISRETDLLSFHQDFHEEMLCFWHRNVALESCESTAPLRLRLLLEALHLASAPFETSRTATPSNFALLFATKSAKASRNRLETPVFCASSAQRSRRSLPSNSFAQDSSRLLSVNNQQMLIAQ